MNTTLQTATTGGYKGVDAVAEAFGKQQWPVFCMVCWACAQEKKKILGMAIEKRKKTLINGYGQFTKTKKIKKNNNKKNK